MKKPVTGIIMKAFASLLVVILLLSAMSEQKDELQQLSYSLSDTTSEVAEVPTWRVGDTWVYAGRFEAETLIRENGVSASIGEISGDSTMRVLEILTMTVENESTLVYKTRMDAEFDKNGVNLDGYSGNLYIDYIFDEWIRVSDLAAVKSDMSLKVDFQALGFIDIEVADITIHNSYAPANEIYDFPMRLGERWMNNYSKETTWSGQSDYINPLPADELGADQTNFGVTRLGSPVNDQGHAISYGGCQDSFEVTGWEKDGSKDSYRWYCPAIRNHAWLHIEDDAGLVMDFRLKTYSPVGSSGVSSSDDPGTRDDEIEVQLEFPLFSLDSNTGVWANMSTAHTGKNVEFRHERTGYSNSAIVTANGSAFITLDSGHAVDDSWTSTDHSSHGIIAWLSADGLIGDTTLTLDENVVAMDLLAVPDRANIERNRSGLISELSELTGWNVIPGDILKMELPVMNRGITTSFAATVTITDPSGYETYASLPALGSLEQATVELYWTVPSDQSIGSADVFWEVNPGAANSNDADSSNNLGSLSLFIGRMPVVLVEAHAAVLTQEALVIDASASSDPDGGKVWCSFYIEYDNGQSHRNAWTTVWTSDCILNWTWIDDGDYSVLVNVVDEERDSVQFLDNAEILNRPPELRIIASRTTASSFGTISLLAVGNDSDSEDSWPGIVDVHWPDAQCEEGWYTHQCTVTWNEEGIRRYTAVATDDDGDVSETWVDLYYSNIAPFDLSAALWDDDSLVEKDSQGVWHVDEDAEYWLVADAEDSINDLAGLQHSWSLSDGAPFVEVSYGPRSLTTVSWSQSGEYNITLRVTDDDGASREKVARVEVANVVPWISGLSDPLPIAEGQTLILNAEVNDSVSDLDSLQVCWDLDPGIDEDESGGADDDCNIIGIEFEYNWQAEGIYSIVMNVVDDDGARASQVVNITVMNQPPRIKVSLPEVIYEGQLIELDASSTSDSENDEPGLVFMWDMDGTVDSNGDGDATNDVDELGKVIKKRWRDAGEYLIVLRVADEDKQNPAVKELTIIVVEDEGGLLDTVTSQVVGPNSSLLVQIMLGVLGLLLIAFIVSRFRPQQEKDAWDDDDDVAIAGGMSPELLHSGPAHSPPEYAFPEAGEEPQKSSESAQPNEPEEQAQPTSMAGLLDELDI